MTVAFVRQFFRNYFLSLIRFQSLTRKMSLGWGSMWISKDWIHINKILCVCWIYCAAKILMTQIYHTQSINIFAICAVCSAPTKHPFHLRKMKRCLARNGKYIWNIGRKCNKNMKNLLGSLREKAKEKQTLETAKDISLNIPVWTIK